VFEYLRQSIVASFANNPRRHCCQQGRERYPMRSRIQLLFIGCGHDVCGVSAIQSF